MNELQVTQAILNEIKKFNNIIILRHINPDGDAYGFQFGLKKLIELNWPNKNVKISGHDNKKLDFIGTKFDEIADQEFDDSLVIIGDTANTARIDEPRWNRGKKIIKIDHHPNREPYGELILVKDDYCATCEILTEFIINNNLKINQEIARFLYHGIVTDTMRFLLRFPKPRTFRLAAFLLEQGFDLECLYQKMYQKTDDEIHFISYVYQNYQKTKHGVTYIIINYETLKKLQMTDSTVAYDNVSLLSNIKNTKIWAFFCQTKNQNEIKVELRSSKLTINPIAEKHGGGGHKTSCGTTISSFEEAKIIIDELDTIAQKD